MKRLFFSIRALFVVGIALFSLVVSAQTYVEMNMTFPYLEDFEGADVASKWTLNAGPAVQRLENKWCIGTAEHWNGNKGLYISSNGGASATYQNTPCTMTAFTKYYLEKGTYDLSFAWKCLGEGTTDNNGRMVGVDAFFVNFLPCTEATTYNGQTTAGLPTTQINVLSVKGQRESGLKHTGEAMAYDKSLYGMTYWDMACAEVTVPADGIYSLVFTWINNATIVGGPSACIDYIQISKRDATPYNIRPSINNSKLNVTWSSTATEFEVRYRKYGETAFQTATGVRSNTFSINGLNDGLYEVFVRAITPNGDTTIWVSSLYNILYDPAAHCVDFANFNDPNVNCYVGNSSNPRTRLSVVDNGPTSMNSRHTMHWLPGETDFCTGGQLKTVPDGEVCSVRLGNWDNGGSGGSGSGEAIVYDWHLDKGDRKILLLKYAVVLEDVDGHTGGMLEPQFTLRITDENWNTISEECDFYNFSPKDRSLTGWKTGVSSAAIDQAFKRKVASDSPEKFVMWRDWNSVGVDLSDYAALRATTIHIVIETHDCLNEAGSGHCGYGYFVVGCKDIKNYGDACGAEPIKTISAPDGFTYRWYPKNSSSNTVSTSQVLDVDQLEKNGNKIEPGNSIYSCECTSKLRPQCKFTLDADLIPAYPVANFLPTSEPRNCTNIVQFNNSSAIYNSSGRTGKKPTSYYWDFGQYGTSELENPFVTLPDEGGDIHARLVVGMNNDECTDTIEIDFTAPPIGPKSDTIRVERCKGNPYSFYGEKLRTDCERTKTFPSAGGCDSSIVLQLSFVQTVHGERYDTICGGEVYYYNGQALAKTGEYPFSKDEEGNRLVASGGCDSALVLHLEVIDEILFDYKVTDELDGPGSGSIELINFNPEWTYYINGEENGALDGLTSGSYELRVVNNQGCEKVMDIALSTTCLETQIVNLPELCADDEEYNVDFEVLAGDYKYYSIEFDNKALRQGFENIDSVTDRSGTITIPMPENVRPDNYRVTVRFHDPVCKDEDIIMVIPMNVKYPTSVMEQKWNNVLALLNERYNGGFKFSAYQWYKNGAVIEGAVNSHIYFGEGANISGNGDVYTVALTREGEDYSIASCAFTPQNREDLRDNMYRAPRMPIAANGMVTGLGVINGQGKAYWWSSTGQLVGTYSIDELTQDIPTPAQSGVYMLELRVDGERDVYKIVVR